MAKQFDHITDEHKVFMLRQKMFFTGSAAAEGRVNVSPKGLDAFRVLGANQVAYLDLTGSGSETSAHIKASKRLTIMFCAFEGAPLILRLYGQGRVLRRNTDAYAQMLPHFDDMAGARQIVRLDVDLVQTSCGFGVPRYKYEADRPTLTRWAEQKGEAGLDAYRREANIRSIDGFSTGMIDLDGG
jgi:Pyridoxamine 5'-phosphate oxidase